MSTTQVIFCNESLLYWQAIEDRLISGGYNISILKAASVKGAVKAIQEKGKCIVLTESVLLGEEYASQLPSLCKARNPDSVVVLYTGEPYDIDVSLFDHYINSYGRDSYNELFSFLRKHCL
ncbi:MAG: hypothetical protein QG654_400 [Patescibacteria group bacterium]|nr:hypothetical protein [Patescibacteria group bacterium]